MEFSMPTPFSIKEEDCCVIDLDAIKTPEDIVYDWDYKVRKEFNQKICPDNKLAICQLMEWYLRDLKTGAMEFQDKETLKNVMLKHIKFLEMSNRRLRCSCNDKYLEIMEEILTYYINIVVDCVTERRKFVNKMEMKKLVAIECRKVKCLLLSCFSDDEFYRILHVLIKVNIDPDSQPCRDLLNHIFGHFIYRKKPNKSDINFCRIYIIFQKWKLLRKSKDREIMEECMYSMYNKNQDLLETNETLKTILLPETSRFVEIGGKLISSINDMAKEYFKYIKSKEKQEEEILEIELDKDGVEKTKYVDWDTGEVEEDEDFDRMYNDLDDELQAAKQSASESVTVKNEDEDCILVSVGTRDVDVKNTLMVYEIPEDDDIAEITYFIKKNSSAKTKTKDKDRNRPTSFLDSTDALPREDPTVSSLDQSVEIMEIEPETTNSQDGTQSNHSTAIVIEKSVKTGPTFLGLIDLNEEEVSNKLPEDVPSLQESVRTMEIGGRTLKAPENTESNHSTAKVEDKSEKTVPMTFLGSIDLNDEAANELPAEVPLVSSLEQSVQPMEIEQELTNTQEDTKSDTESHCPLSKPIEDTDTHTQNSSDSSNDDITFVSRIKVEVFKTYKPIDEVKTPTEPIKPLSVANTQILTKAIEEVRTPTEPMKPLTVDDTQSSTEAKKEVRTPKEPIKPLIVADTQILTESVSPEISLPEPPKVFTKMFVTTETQTDFTEPLSGQVLICSVEEFKGVPDQQMKVDNVRRTENSVSTSTTESQGEEQENAMEMECSNMTYEVIEKNLVPNNQVSHPTNVIQDTEETNKDNSCSVSKIHKNMSSKPFKTAAERKFSPFDVNSLVSAVESASVSSLQGSKPKSSSLSSEERLSKLVEMSQLGSLVSLTFSTLASCSSLSLPKNDSVPTDKSNLDSLVLASSSTLSSLAETSKQCKESKEDSAVGTPNKSDLSNMDLSLLASSSAVSCSSSQPAKAVGTLNKSDLSKLDSSILPNSSVAKIPNISDIVLLPSSLRPVEESKEDTSISYSPVPVTKNTKAQSPDISVLTTSAAILSYAPAIQHQIANANTETKISTEQEQPRTGSTKLSGPTSTFAPPEQRTPTEEYSPLSSSASTLSYYSPPEKLDESGLDSSFSSFVSPTKETESEISSSPSVSSGAKVSQLNPSRSISSAKTQMSISRSSGSLLTGSGLKVGIPLSSVSTDMESLKLSFNNSSKSSSPSSPFEIPAIPLLLSKLSDSPSKSNLNSSFDTSALTSLVVSKFINPDLNVSSSSELSANSAEICKILVDSRCAEKNSEDAKPEKVDNEADNSNKEVTNVTPQNDKSIKLAQRERVMFTSPQRITTTSANDFDNNWDKIGDRQDLEEAYSGPVASRIQGNIVNPDENFNLYECEKTSHNQSHSSDDLTGEGLAIQQSSVTSSRPSSTEELLSPVFEPLDVADINNFTKNMLFESRRNGLVPLISQEKPLGLLLTKSGSSVSVKKLEHLQYNLEPVNGKLREPLLSHDSTSGSNGMLSAKPGKNGRKQTPFPDKIETSGATQQSPLPSYDSASGSNGMLSEKPRKNGRKKIVFSLFKEVKDELNGITNMPEAIKVPKAPKEVANEVRVKTFKEAKRRNSKPVAKAKDLEEMRKFNELSKIAKEKKDLFKKSKPEMLRIDYEETPRPVVTVISDNLAAVPGSRQWRSNNVHNITPEEKGIKTNGPLSHFNGQTAGRKRRNPDTNGYGPTPKKPVPSEPKVTLTESKVTRSGRLSKRPQKDYSVLVKNLRRGSPSRSPGLEMGAAHSDIPKIEKSNLM